MIPYNPVLPLQGSYVAIYKIYVLKDPLTQDIFYVGQTEQELQIRLSGHLNESRGVNPRKREKIDSIVGRGEKPLIESVEVIRGTCYIDKMMVNEREIHWVKFYKLQGVELLNAALMANDAECKEYKTYLKSIQKGESSYRYYYCGKTYGGHPVYDENRMNADGFRFPDQKKEVLITPADEGIPEEDFVEKHTYHPCYRDTDPHLYDFDIY